MINYLTIKTNLDDTVNRERKFYLHRIQGKEGICESFEYMLSISSQERLSDEEIQKLLGEPLTVRIGFLDRKYKPGYRSINGIACRLTESGCSRASSMPDIWRYEIEIGPWTKQLEMISDCRIFQKKGNTGMSVINEVLNELNLGDFKDRTGGGLPERELIVMYNESVGHFIRRLCLQDGIMWRFEHFEKAHKLVFFKDSTILPEIANEDCGLQDGVKLFCREWRHNPVRQLTLASYNPEHPPVKNVVQQTGIKSGLLQDFLYPAGFTKRAEGDDLIERKITALTGKMRKFRGESTMRAFASGYRFNLRAPMLPDMNGKIFLINELNIDATDETYTNRFTAVEAKKPFIVDCDKSVRKPEIVGTQTAVVVGAAGKGKVQTDKKGRVKVRFHWDHHAPENAAHTSAFVRVSQPATGSLRGFVFTPRIGEEVMVSFEDGDPEKPLIVGGLYSQDHPTPNVEAADTLADKIMDLAGLEGDPRHTTPDAQPYTGTIKSESDGNSNRITFTDRKEDEHLEIKASKDLNINVGHDLNIEVEDDIFIIADNENVNAAENVNTEAIGSIINATLGTMSNTAGSDIIHAALGGVFNIAGGLVSNMAGATITNTAILSVNNESGGPLSNTAGVLLANTSASGIINEAASIKNDGKQAVVNLSLADIINNAADEIAHKTMIQQVKTDDVCSTETGDKKIKAVMPKIN